MNGSIRTYLRRQRGSEALQQCLPRLYIEAQKLRYRRKRFLRRIVTRQHALMIEGFPRSGTSFAVQAMQSANPDLVGRIATHLHATAHLIRAVQLGVPGIVLVRDPAAAVTSLVALGAQAGLFDLNAASDSEKAALIAQASRRYTLFNRTLFGLRDRLMIVRFEDSITDFGVVIDAFNRRFGTAFIRFDHTKQAASHILDRPKIHLGPNMVRDEIKQNLLAHYAVPANAPNRLLAEQAYADCLKAAPALTIAS